jgi:hypothetical protein
VVASLVSGIMKDLKNKAHDLTESSGVHPSIDEENFKEYMQRVLKEVKKGVTIECRFSFYVKTY